MKKLYLLLDEWDNDRNFVGEELKLICEKYDVTVICNSAESDLEHRARYLIYKRPSKVYALNSLLKGVFDRSLWAELKTALKYESDVHSTVSGRISEAVRFYINADMFRCFMKKNKCFENGAVYYSYWNFWKCFAVTHDIHRYPDSRVISRIHGYELYDEQIPSGYQPFKKAMDAALARLIFVSETGKEHYLRKFGVTDDGRYPVCLLGTGKPVAACPDNTKLLYERDEFILVSCSRIDHNKRVERIIDALALIDDISISWVHFGGGVLEQEVRNRAEELLSGSRNIHFEIKGMVDNRDIHDFYEKYRPDAFINVSVSEGNPVSVMEALSYGIPVIAPAVCNFPKMIQDCGILVSAQCNAKELVDSIRNIANMSEDEVKLLRGNAYKCWDDKFNADKNNRSFVEEVIDRL